MLDQFVKPLEEAAAASNPAQGSTLGLIIPLAAFAVVFYFFIYKPQKKQEKQTAQMRNSIAVGDEITTNGGIMGKVITVKEDYIIIETGADRNKLKLQRWAIHSVDKKIDAPEAAAPSKPQAAFKVKDVEKSKKDK